MFEVFSFFFCSRYAKGDEKFPRHEEKSFSHNSREKRDENCIFIPFVPRKLRTESRIFTNDLQWDEKKNCFTAANTSSSPCEERTTIFSQHDARTAATLRVVMLELEGRVCWCDKGVVFCVPLGEKRNGRKKNLFAHQKKKGISRKKVKRFWGFDELHHDHVHTQNTKFIRTTKNLTIEQQAFMVIFFAFFSPSQKKLHNAFNHTKIFFLYHRDIFSLHDTAELPPLIYFIFYFSTQITVRDADRMIRMFTSDWVGNDKCSTEKEKKDWRESRESHARWSLRARSEK